MMISLICPNDGSRLAPHQAGDTCPGCGRRFERRDGVVCMIDRPDPFYEGAYENTVSYLPRSEALWSAWPLWLINSGFIWSVRRNVDSGATVVELGCAGGVRYLAAAIG